MVKKAIIKFCIAAVEEKMLKIYAITMSIIFLSLWLPAMVNVVYQMLKIYGVI